jgi:hypothetical protein
MTLCVSVPCTWHKLNMKSSWQKNCPVLSSHNMSGSFCYNTSPNGLSWLISNYRSQSEGGIPLISRDICMTSHGANSFPCLTPSPNLNSKLVMYNSVLLYLILFNQTFTDCFYIKSMPCLKYLWGYVIASEGNLAEQKSLCVEQNLWYGDTGSYRVRKRIQQEQHRHEFLCFPLLLIPFLLGLLFRPQDEGSTFLRNVCRFLPENTALHPRRYYSS